MRWIIIFLLCSLLKASQNEQTYELFMPENFRELFELPGRLLSNNAETFPDLSTIYETYQKQLYDLEDMQLWHNNLSKITNDPFNVRDFFGLFLFVQDISHMIGHIFFKYLPSAYEMHPDILSKSPQEQANIIYDSCKVYEERMKHISNFAKNQLQFSNDPIDCLGRLIINGEEVYRGISDPANALTYEVILPEHLRKIFELPGKLISNNSEIFPELSTLNSEHCQTLYDKFQKIITPEYKRLLFPVETLDRILGHNPEQEEEDYVRQNACMLRKFLGSVGGHISDFLKKEVPKIFKEFPGILDWSTAEQAKAVYIWYKDKSIFMTIKHIDLFMKKHVRFSDAPGDRFGGLIVNEEKFYGSTHAE